MRRGAACRFVLGPDSAGAVAFVREAGFQVHVLDAVSADQGLHASETGKLAGPAELLIVDHYGLGAEFEHACRTWSTVVAAIDDGAGRAHDVDFILDPNYGSVAEDYARVAPGARIFAGSTVTLLRKVFSDVRAATLSERVSRGGKIKRVLVAFGGSDPQDYTRTTVELLATFAEFRIDVLVGGGYHAVDELSDCLERLGPRLELWHSRDDVEVLMAQADLAIGGAGGMSWERCCLGLPAVIVIMAENQRVVASALCDAGAAICLGSGKDALQQKLGDMLQKLTAEHETVEELSACAARMCDGHGADRAADQIIAFLNSDQ